MKRYNIIVVGKVQGVWYRKNTKSIADKLLLFGFVKNQPDSTVFIDVEGTENNLNEFITWCRKGPEKAIVSELKITELPTAGYSSFEIKYL